MQLALFDPTEPRILPQTPAAFFTINRLVQEAGPDGRMVPRLRQSAYPLRRMAELLPTCAGAVDVYTSQATFATRRRRVVTIDHATHAAADLDTYRDPDLVQLSPGDLVRALLTHCDDQGIPPPSIVLSSGRGLYAKWFWSTPIPRAEAGRATAVNRALVRHLAAFRADPAAVDLARVLRVCASVNSKNGRPVEIMHLAGTQDAPLTYDFAAFADGILPAQVDDHPTRCRHRPPVRVGRFTRESWHWSVLEDIRALAGIRYPGGIVAAGARDTFAFLAACQLARVVPASALAREAGTVTRSFLPAAYVAGELRTSCATLLDRAARAGGGEFVFFEGRQRTPIYGYGKCRMIELLQVTPAEERRMGALISDAEKARRHTESERARRRAAGAIERATYEATAASRRCQVADLRGRGMTWRAIGAELGISEGEARRLNA